MLNLLQKWDKKPFFLKVKLVHVLQTKLGELTFKYNGVQIYP